MAALYSLTAARSERNPGSDHWRSVAVRALGFVSNDRSEFDRFLARSKISRTELMTPPVANTHLTAVLDFLITNEAVLKKFASKADLPMEAAYEARRILALSKSRPLMDPDD